MEFNPFEIIYFPNFIFNNDAPPKAKFFISIKKINKEIIIVSLPSSKDFVPDIIKKEGCIEYPDRCISCYCFFKNSLICEDSDFTFNKDTFIYANGVDAYSIEKLKSYYPIEGVDYFKKGTLTKDLQKKIYECLKNSFDIRNKIKKVL